MQLVSCEIGRGQGHRAAAPTQKSERASYSIMPKTKKAGTSVDVEGRLPVNIAVVIVVVISLINQTLILIVLGHICSTN